jgi:voltage-gated potassium channel
VRLKLRQTGKMAKPSAPRARSKATAADQLGAAELFARRLDIPMGIIGVIFLFVVLGQLLSNDPQLTLALTIVGWVFWAIFLTEFLLRAYIAGFQHQFWKKNWWQAIFLLVPFLRFFRILESLRLVRVARFSRMGVILSAGVRSSKSAGRLLTNRIGWLIAVTAVVILASSQLLYAAGSHFNYADSLFEAAITTITGTGLTPTDGFSRTIHVLLAVYSVAVFATLAGTLGAFFLRAEKPKDAASGTSTSMDPSPDQDETESDHVKHARE